jgi:hypothetical protein
MVIGHGSRAIPRRAVALGMVVILGASGLSLAFFLRNATPGSSSTTGSGQPVDVTVFGLASTVGQGTHMTAVVFTSSSTGANFTASVSRGNFTANLPNGAVYHVAANWAGNYSWQAGSVEKGELTVNMSAGSMAAMSYNLQVETPPTIVAVHGTILWTLSSSQPVSVVYTASDGETFQAPVHNTTFSTRLPNMIDYQVKVFWRYADGSTDYLFAPNQTINEGSGVVGLDLVIN